jgi:hypothetical protein
MGILHNTANALAASWVSQPLKFTLYPFAKAYNALKRREQPIPIPFYTSEGLQPIQSQLHDELCVRKGPFEGMKYSSAASAGSALYPKLLGTYEREITPFIEDILAKDFDIIIDVGCAEGYYAVGFARRFKERLEKVIAYDIDENAQALCAANATLNDVSVDIRGLCEAQALIEDCSHKNCLIFVDAEGYEKILLSDNLANTLSHCTFLVESHDFIDIDTTRNMLNSFSHSHRTQVLSSIDDIDKAYQYDDLDMHNHSLSEKRCLFAENRPTIMKWIYATPLPQI